MKARAERHTQLMRDILNLRPDQEAAFQAFLADMKPQPHQPMAGREQMDAAQEPTTTPERLDRMAAMMSKFAAERQAQFQHHADAIKRFYAVLSPEQKRAFDGLAELGGMARGGPQPDMGGMHPAWRGEDHPRPPAAGGGAQ
jgi:Spy/CpxP family protein refolding chaperone